MLATFFQPGRNRPLGEERRQRQRGGTRHVCRRKGEASRRGGRMLASALFLPLSSRRCESVANPLSAVPEERTMRETEVQIGTSADGLRGSSRNCGGVMRRLLLLAIPLVVFLITNRLSSGQSASPIPSDAKAAMGDLQKEPFRAHMAFLADDLLEGRGTGKRGHEVAARYVAAQFEALALKPAGQDGTYYQRVPLREITIEPDKCAVTITEKGFASQLKWGDDFIMRGSAVSPDVSIEAPVVFVGYGVRTPDGKYDDYAGGGGKGKIVAALKGA